MIKMSANKPMKVSTTEIEKILSQYGTSKRSFCDKEIQIMESYYGRVTYQGIKKLLELHGYERTQSSIANYCQRNMASESPKGKGSVKNG